MPTHKESSFSPCLSAVLGIETQMVGRYAGGRGEPVLCCCYFAATGGARCALARHLYVMKTEMCREPWVCRRIKM